MKDYSANCAVPFDRSFWVEPHRFLAGFFPGDRDPERADARLLGLIESGIRVVINLMEEDEVDHGGRLFVPYAARLRDIGAEEGATVEYVRHPIPDVSIPTVEGMTAILDRIDVALERGDPVYVHCWGGRGRTGTVVGCWLARHGIARGQAALDRIDGLRSSVPDRHMPAPEAASQLRMVMEWGSGEMV